MPFNRRPAIEARLARYRQIERRLVDKPESASETLRVIIADLELQLAEMEKEK